MIHASEPAPERLRGEMIAARVLLPGGARPRAAHMKLDESGIESVALEIMATSADALAIAQDDATDQRVARVLLALLALPAPDLRERLDRARARNRRELAAMGLL